MAKYEVQTEQGKYLIETESPQGEISTPQTFRQNQLDRTISQRPDIYSQAVQGFQNIPQQAKQFNPFNPISSLQGMGSLLNIGLKSLSGVTQRTEAAVANPFLEMGANKGTIGSLPYRMGKSIKQGIAGERLGELGDVARQAGIPEPISAGLGLLGTGIIGGALSKGARLSQKANNLSKLETTYGRDIGKNLIRWSTGMPDIAVEHGMKRGWKNILSKENLNPTVPTRIANNVLDNLDEITQKEYDKFGKVLSKVRTGNVKAIDVNQVLEDTLKQNGYLDEGYRQTLKSRGQVVNKIQNFIDTAQKNKIQPTDNIPIDVIQTFKNILKSFVPEKNWIGKTRSLKGEQRLAKDLSNNLDNLIAYNSYGVKGTAYKQAKRRYTDFKNYEKAIMNTFSEVVGQEVKPTADKIVNVFNLHPTQANEELLKLKNIGEFLKNKGYGDFSNKLLDWLTTQSAVVQPQQGGASLYPFRLLAESTKYGARQTLKSGYPTVMGKYGGRVGESIVKPSIPPALLRMVTGRNSQEK